MVNRNRRGLTLVEMLVALSLCVMMIGAITGILAALVQQQRQRLVLSSDHWQANFHRMLWADLSQARWISRMDSGIALALADGSVVTYEMTKGDLATRSLTRGSFVYRENISLGQIPAAMLNSDSRGYRTIVWSIASIQFLRGDANGTVQPIPGTWSPAPSALYYRLEKSDSNVAKDHWIMVR